MSNIFQILIARKGVTPEPGPVNQKIYQNVLGINDILRDAKESFAVDIVAVLVLKSNCFEIQHCIGTHHRTIPLREAISAEVLRCDQPLVVTNLRRDARFSDNPSVVGDAHLRFYVGVPLRNDKGQIIGVMTLISRHADTFDAEKLQRLEFCAQTAAKIVQREMAAKADAAKSRFERRSVVIKPEWDFTESCCDVFEHETFLREVDHVVEMSLVRSRCAGLVGIEPRSNGRPPAEHMLPVVEQKLVLALRPRLRQHDLIARLPQRRFAVLLPMLRYRADLEFVSHRIEGLFATEFAMPELPGLEFTVTSAMYPIDGYGGDDLVTSLFKRAASRPAMR